MSEASEAWGATSAEWAICSSLSHGVVTLQFSEELAAALEDLSTSFSDVTGTVSVYMGIREGDPWCVVLLGS